MRQEPQRSEGEDEAGSCRDATKVHEGETELPRRIESASRKGSTEWQTRDREYRADRDGTEPSRPPCTCGSEVVVACAW
jgi:hypothetical protein